MFQILYLQKVGQGHGVQFSQGCHSMVNIKIYKSRPHIFALALTTSEILTFQSVVPSESRSRLWSIMFRNEAIP